MLLKLASGETPFEVTNPTCIVPLNRNVAKGRVFLFEVLSVCLKMFMFFLSLVLVFWFLIPVQVCVSLCLCVQIEEFLARSHVFNPCNGMIMSLKEKKWKKVIQKEGKTLALSVSEQPTAVVDHNYGGGGVVAGRDGAWL